LKKTYEIKGMRIYSSDLITQEAHLEDRVAVLTSRNEFDQYLLRDAEKKGVYDLIHSKGI